MLSSCRHKTHLPGVAEEVLINDSAADCTILAIRSWQILENTGHTVAIGYVLLKKHQNWTLFISVHDSYPTRRIQVFDCCVLCPVGSRYREYRYSLAFISCERSWRYYRRPTTNNERIVRDDRARTKRMLTERNYPFTSTTGWCVLDYIQVNYWRVGQPWCHRIDCTQDARTLQEWSHHTSPSQHEAFTVRFAIKKTLATTTQLIPSVEAEARDKPRDHLISRLWALRPKRLRGTWFTDKFYCSIKSIRGAHHMLPTLPGTGPKVHGCQSNVARVHCSDDVWSFCTQCQRTRNY